MDDLLLEKFFKGQCTEQEKQEVLLWYLSGQADPILSERLEAYWHEESNEKKEWRKALVLNKIHQKIIESDKIPVRRLNPTPFWRSWWYAAAVFLLIISAWYGYVKFDHASNANITSESKLESTPKNIYIHTDKGEKRTITLKDGTVVNLNADSRIWYSQAFGKNGMRELYLEGEAFFDVARDTLCPFQVYTGGVATTVLGTSFNINAYAPEESVTVSVITGKVEVRQTQGVMSPVYLVPDEQAEFSNQDSVLRKSQVNYQKALSWKEGKLYFKNASFKEVVTTLERWYGIEIEVKRQHTEDGLSGIYANRSLESALNGIGFVLGFDYEIQGKKVIIK